MLRKKFKQRALETEPDFRYRGKEPSRIEAFSDDVLAFCVTLLIVSLSVPETFSDLVKAFNGLFGFAISVLMLFGIWYEHYIFFMRYGISDKTTIYLNGLLLFTILIYIYPLKFLFSFFASLIGILFNHFVNGIDADAGLNHLFTHVIKPDQMPWLMVIYGIGAAAVFIIFALMYRNAWKRREELALNEVEKHYTRWSIYKNLCMAAPPFLSAIVTMATMGYSIALASALSGTLYGLYGGMALFGVLEKKAKKKILNNPDPA